MATFFKNMLGTKDSELPELEGYGSEWITPGGLAILEDTQIGGIWTLIHFPSNNVILRSPYRNWLKEIGNRMAPLEKWHKPKSYSRALNNQNFQEHLKTFEVWLTEYTKALNSSHQHHPSPNYSGIPNRQITYTIYWDNGVSQQVKGVFLAPGIGANLTGSKYEIWQIFHLGTGKPIGIANSFKRAQEWANCVSTLLDWTKEESYMIYHTKDIRPYWIQLHTSMSNLQSLSLPNEELKNTAHILLNMTIQAKEAYINDTFKEFEALIGLDELKTEVRNFIKKIKGEKKLRADGKINISAPSMHMLFTGPAGTGKTEVAKIMAKMLHRTGILPTDKVISTNRAGLVGEHIGETAQKTSKKIQESMGGVLFIDEAYSLASGNNSNNDFGKEAIATLIEAMENYRDKFVVILAGYKPDMENLLNYNEGFRSRIAYEFQFHDYTPKQLTEITIRFLQSKGYNCTQIIDVVEKAILHESKNSAINGNARWARTFSEKITSHHMIRIGEATATTQNMYTLLPEDVYNSSGLKAATNSQRGLDHVKEQALSSLNNLVGMEELKAELRRMMNFFMIEKRRIEQNISTGKPMLHMTFEGNPGTGKTTVAKIISQFLKGIEFLESGHLIEADRSALVASYTGQTAPKVIDLVNRARGGVLFIDEAYTLASDQFGEEAIATLINEMEKYKDELVVILAGYKTDMDKLLAVNVGFESRLAYRFHFADYSKDEILSIINYELKKQQLVPNEAATTKLNSMLAIEFLKQQGKINGNGRWARTLVEKIRLHQSDRIIETNSNDLLTILESDVSKAFLSISKN